MYRDDSTVLDEHDRAVGAIQIADGLVVACLNASKQLASVEHRWRAVREIHDGYGEIWRQLDSARHLLANRGANTMGFDELRAQVVPVLAVKDNGVETSPLEDARRAVAELRLAMPGADWKTIEARTQSLANSAKFARGGQRIAVFGVATALALAAGAAWVATADHEPRVDPRITARIEQQMATQRELAVIVDDRKDRIDQLALMIGGRCDRDNVSEYVKLLSMDGRWSDAHGYGVEYLRHCPDDADVRKWSDYAKRKLDRLSRL